MSATDDDGEEIPGREIAYRLFAAEYDDASFSYAESDEERAPNYVISPTGARLNRLFAVGTLTEVTPVNDEMVRARVVDPTGAFVVYAGQYQPDALATLEQLEPPAFVAVTGKARTFQPDDSDQVYTSIRPESIATVDAATRDRWVVSAAEQTLDRVGTYAAAAGLDASTEGDAADDLTDALEEAGVDTGLAAGIPLARDHYGTTPSYLAALRDCALEAVEVVAGDRDQVSGLSLQPGGSSPDYESATFESLADLGAVDLEGLESVVNLDTESEAAADSQPAEAVAATTGGSETATDADADTVDDSIGTGSAAGTASGTDRDAAPDSDVDEAVEPDTQEPSEREPETADATADVDDAAADEPTAAFDESTDVAETADTAVDDGSDTDETGSVDASDTDDTGAVDADDGDEELGDFDAGDSGMYEMDDDEREQLEEEFGAEFTTGSEVDEPGEAGIDVPEPEDDESESAADATSTTEPTSSDEAETAADDDIGAPPESGLEDEAAADATDTAATDESDADETADELVDDSDAETAEGTDDEAADDGDDEPAEDVDLEAYVVETMQELDDGDGADRTTLVETVADDTGASEDEVEDAIQDALMGGQCYEPDDETLKAI